MKEKNAGRLQRIWGELRKGENIDLYILVVVALVVAALNVVSQQLIPQDWLNSLILAVLALLASSFLGLRHRLQDIWSRVGETTGIKLQNRREFQSSLDERLKGARQVYISGLSLRGVVTKSWRCFKEMKEVGCEVRLLVIDPQSPAVSTSVGSVEDSLLKPNISGDIRETVNRLRPLLEEERFEIRFTSFTPPFSLLIIDPERPEGGIQVELFGYGITPQERPHFLLTQADEPWYGFFKRQFEQLWDDAEKHPAPALPTDSACEPSQNGAAGERQQEGSGMSTEGDTV